MQPSLSLLLSYGGSNEHGPSLQQWIVKIRYLVERPQPCQQATEFLQRLGNRVAIEPYLPHRQARPIDE